VLKKGAGFDTIKEGFVRSNSATLAARLARFSFLICLGCFFAKDAADPWNS